MISELQAVLIPRSKFKLREAKAYLDSENWVPIKPVHRTENFYRFRIADPKKFKRFTTKVLNNGVELVLGWQK